jgi:dTDP-4-amino-4,6-dideoxygalactose transaminase
MRHHGCTPADSNDHVRVGASGRLDNLQAALLLVKLPHLDEWNEQRREAAALYRRALADLPADLPPEEGVFHLFAIELDDRDRVRGALRDAGVGTAIHYPRPVHLNPAWSHLGSRGDHPAAERLAERTLSLPMFPGITAAEIERVADALRAQMS